MRKTLLATSALFAALAFAGAASAQNISVQNNQNNAASVISRLDVANVRVGAVLDGRATSIGNLYQLSAPTGQGIAEVASNNGGLNSPQINTGLITSTANVGGGMANAAPVVTVNSTSAANVINSEGVTVWNNGNRVVGQQNLGSVSSNLNANNVSAGNLTLVSTAMGNSFSGVATSSVSIGAGLGGGGGAFNQTNAGRVTSDLNIGFNVGATSTEIVRGQAVGNSASFDAPTVSANLTQTNTGVESATVNFNDGGVSRGSLTVSGGAIGNTVSTTGGLSVGSNLIQANTAGQDSRVNINGGAAFNGSTADFTSSAIGNAVSFTTTGNVGLNGSQSNSGVGQVAILNINAFQGGGVGAAGAMTGQATAVGDLISVDTNGAFSSGMGQNNTAPIYANLNASSIIAGSSASLASLAAGNILQVSALGGSEGINGAANQFNTGAISSVTNITSGSFGNLTGAATSVGNLTSVSVR